MSFYEKNALKLEIWQSVTSMNETLKNLKMSDIPDSLGISIGILERAIKMEEHHLKLKTLMSCEHAGLAQDIRCFYNGLDAQRNQPHVLVFRRQEMPMEATGGCWLWCCKYVQNKGIQWDQIYSYKAPEEGRADNLSQDFSISMFTLSGSPTHTVMDVSGGQVGEGEASSTELNSKATGTLALYDSSYSPSSFSESLPDYAEGKPGPSTPLALAVQSKAKVRQEAGENAPRRTLQKPFFGPFSTSTKNRRALADVRQRGKNHLTKKWCESLSNTLAIENSALDGNLVDSILLIFFDKDGSFKNDLSELTSDQVVLFFNADLQDFCLEYGCSFSSTKYSAIRLIELQSMVDLTQHFFDHLVYSDGFYCLLLQTFVDSFCTNLQLAFSIKKQFSSDIVTKISLKSGSTILKSYILAEGQRLRIRQLEQDIQEMRQGGYANRHAGGQQASRGRDLRRTHPFSKYGGSGRNRFRDNQSNYEDRQGRR